MATPPKPLKNGVYPAISPPEGRGKPIESNKNYGNHDEVEGHTYGVEEGKVNVGEDEGRRNCVSRLEGGYERE